MESVFTTLSRRGTKTYPVRTSVPYRPSPYEGFLVHLLDHAHSVDLVLERLGDDVDEQEHRRNEG
jgi:hypothetical protein